MMIKKKHLQKAPSHKDVYKIVGTGVLDGPRHIIFGRAVVFSADLCYNEAIEKPSSGRKVARVA